MTNTQTKRTKINLYTSLNENNTLSKLSFENDIYHNSEYAKLYGEVFEFSYSKDNDFLKITAIKESIKGSPYFDISTPYGYGGFLFKGDKEFLKESLEKLKEKCLSENIIAFFIRFHPFDAHLELYATMFHFFSKNRKIVVVDTQNPIGQIRQSYTSKLKSPIKKSKMNLKINHASLRDIANIQTLYNNTMLKTQADDFYFFNADYFRELLTFKEVVMLKADYNSRIIGFSSFFLCKDFSYYHLSASTGEMFANAALLDFFFEYANMQNSKFCILGGGLQNEDNLYFFKQKFSNLECDFYIGGLVFHQTIFENFCKGYQNDKFLKYRT